MKKYLSAGIDWRGFYVGCRWFAISWTRRGWLGIPSIYTMKPYTVVGFGFYIRLGEYP